MFDAYMMCFKKDERTIETFRNTILRNPDIDVSTLVLDLTTQRDWEKSSVTETLLSCLKEFTPQEASFIQNQQPQSQDAQAHEFITNDKTVKIDFSELKDFDKQCYFAFVVLSKFIHYLNILKYCNRPFTNVEEINATILNNLEYKVKQGDILYFLGDLLFLKKSNII